MSAGEGKKPMLERHSHVDLRFCADCARKFKNSGRMRTAARALTLLCFLAGCAVISGSAETGVSLVVLAAAIGGSCQVLTRNSPDIRCLSIGEFEMKMDFSSTGYAPIYQDFIAREISQRVQAVR